MKHSLCVSLVLLGISFTEVNAQGSPLRCAYSKDQYGTWINCDSLEQGLVITDVILNRGNCESSYSSAKRNNIPFLLDHFNKPKNFGEKLLFSVVCPNLIEYTVKSNKGDFTWQVR